jgi:hypothetical protein
VQLGVLRDGKAKGIFVPRRGASLRMRYYIFIKRLAQLDGRAINQLPMPATEINWPVTPATPQRAIPAQGGSNTPHP